MSQGPSDSLPPVDPGARRSADESSADWVADKTPELPRVLQVFCPHCRQCIAVPVGDLGSEMTCSACGSRIGPARQPAAGTAVDADSRQQAPRVLGHFQLLTRLGVGGFGEVWKARDVQLDRVVAIKIPHRSQIGSEEFEKFLREARAAAQLRHPNIVSVHEVGLEGELVYIVSDFIEGLPLNQWLAAHRLEHRAAAGLCLKIAEALNHAHGEGVIHRDLKPSNIMMDSAGEPHLMDFGLAKREAGEITMTLDGQIMGTPAYMPPEQAQGLSHTADRRSDVYSMGVILFELLTGELPFRGSFEMLIKQVVEDEAPSPRKFDGRVPRDLETITLKCLQKDPSRRYASAKALADDLARFLGGVPVLARPVGSFERAARWCQRNPLVAGSAGLALAGLLFGLVTGWASYVRTSRALDETRQAQARSELYDQHRRQVVDDLFTRVSEDTLLNQPGMQPVRRDLLLRARDYYERFLTQKSDERLQDELALAQFRVGRITEEVESPGKALPSYEKARSSQAKLVESSPGNAERLWALGNTLNAIGGALTKLQCLDRALVEYQAATEIRLRLVELAPREAEFKRMLANTYMNIGLVEKERDPGRARQSMEKAQALRQSLQAASNTDPKLARDLAMGYYNLATVAIASGGVELAATSLNRARTLFDGLAKREHGDLSAPYQLALCDRLEADLKCGNKRHAEGLALYQRAREILAGLTEKNPSVPEFQVALAEIQINIGQAEYELGRRDRALASFEEARRLLAPLVAQYADVARYRHDFLVTLRSLGKLDPQPSRRADVLKTLISLESQLRRASQHAPDAAGLREQLQSIRQAIEEFQRSGPPGRQSPQNP